MRSIYKVIYNYNNTKLTKQQEQQLYNKFMKTMNEIADVYEDSGDLISFEEVEIMLNNYIKKHFKNIDNNQFFFVESSIFDKFCEMYPELFDDEDE